MKRLRLWVLVMAGLSLTAAGSSQGDDERRLRADLTGLEEVPVVNTVASGKFRARISRRRAIHRVQVELQRATGDGVTGPHPYRPAERERQHRHLALSDRDKSCSSAASISCIPGSDDFTGTITAADCHSRGHGKSATQCE